MAESNLVEATAIRKRQVIGEIIKNTEFCCLVWKETGQPGQYTASTRGNILLIGNKEYTFYISKINSGIYLDVLTNCKRFVTYNSSNFPDVATLYDTIEGIAERRIEQITDAIQNLQSVPPKCGLLFTEYTRGGIVVGGKAARQVKRKGTEGGIEVGGHAPYNQVADSTGGATLGGEARVNPIIEFPEGGIVAGGTAFPDQRIEVGGGIVAGGTILFETNLSTTGGVLVGGTIPEESVIQNVIASGGVNVGQTLDAWYSFADNTSGAILYSFSYGGIQTQYEYDSTADLERLAIDYQNKRVFYLDITKQIHKSSQLNPLDDVVIGNIVGSYYANIDYDNRYLAYQDGGNVIVIDDNGNTVNSFAYPGALSAIAIDGTNEHIYLSLSLGSGAGGYRIRKYDINTFTQLGDHPVSIATAPTRMALDRESGILFYGYGGGVEQGNLRIYQIDTEFTFETNFNFGWGGGTYDFDPDILTKQLIVWLRDSSEVAGSRYRIIRMDYDGSNQSSILTTPQPIILQRLWVESNPSEFADVEFIKAPVYGGIVAGGEATVSVIFGP